MRTEDDLRRALADLAAGSAGLRLTLDRAAAASRRRRRIRLAGTAAACATLVAAAVAVPTALVRQSGPATATPAGPDRSAGSRLTSKPPRPTVEPGTVLRFDFTVDPVPGHEFVPAEIVRGRQTWMDLSRNPGDGAEVVVYAPGRVDEATIRGGTAIEVNGHRGYFGSAVDTDTVGGGKRVGRPDPATFWEYAPNAWAVVQGAWTRDVGRAEEMKIAKAVRFGAGPAFGVPYRLGWLPNGLEVTALERGFYYVGGWDLTLTIADTTSRANPPVEFSIIVTPVPPAEARGPHTSAPTRDHHFGVTFGTSVVRGGEALSIDFRPYLGALRYPEAVQRRILDSITWAPSLTDRDTWFDTGAAVPRR